MCINNIMEEKGIKYLMHFTPLENLENILTNGLLSREYLDNNNTGATCLDSIRADRHREGICLSVSFPNYKMFYSYRQQLSDKGWAVIVLDASLINDLDCAFFPTNSAYAGFQNIELENFKTTQAFNNLFFDEVQTKNEIIKRERNFLPKDPTDVQAEVMVLEKIPIKYILGCELETEELVEEFQKKFPNLKFITRNSGFFSSRDYFRN